MYRYTMYTGYKEVIHGIPQGSILGPRSFTTYVNDMCNVISALSVFMFTNVRILLLFI